MSLPAASGHEAASRSRLLWLSRALLGLLVTASLSLGWWSIQRLRPLQGQGRVLSAEIIQLTAGVGKLESLLDRREQDKWSNSVQSAEGLVFPDQPSIADWLERLKDRMTALGLEGDARFGPMRPLAFPGRKLAILPLTVEVHPGSSSGDRTRTYQRLLQLFQHLAQSPHRVDFVELTVAGGTNSAASAIAVIELWVKAEGS